MPADPAIVQPEAVALDQLVTASTTGDGVHWTLSAGSDLNANVVHLDADHRIEAHVNDEVDVLIVVLAGDGTLVAADARHDLRPQVLALAPRGTRRAIAAGERGITYLTVHRRRGPLGIGPTRRAAGVHVEVAEVADEGGESPCLAHLLADDGSIP